jgi:hypothetical protein
MPTSIYACNTCNYELFNNLEIIIHDKKRSRRESNLDQPTSTSSVTARHKSLPSFVFDHKKARGMSSSRRFLNKDNLSHLGSDKGSDCDIEAATVVSAGGHTDIPKREFLSFKAF